MPSSSSASRRTQRANRRVPWGQVALGLGAIGLVLLGMVPLLGAAPILVTIAVAGRRMVLAGAALGLCLSAYTLVAQASAPRERIGAAMCALTFAHQVGGSSGTAAFGWLLLGVADRPIALALVFAAAAAISGLALAVGPRRDHELAERARAGSS